MTSRRPYIIRALYDWIVDNHCTPYIVVACSVAGVEVPAEYVRDDHITLNLGASATRNLDIGTDFIGMDCRFGGRPVTVRFPVGAVVGIYARETGQGMGFGVEQGPDDTPDGPPGPGGSSDPGGPPKPNGPPKLSLVR